MGIIINSNSVGTSLFKLQDFPKIYDDFCEATKTETNISTAGVEAEGASLLKDGLDNVQRVNDFVRSVLDWGGKTGNRVRGNLDRYQKEGAFTNEEFVKVVADSARMLQSGDLESAIENITSIKGLHISYGSKILRMLSPQQAGVYDSILDEELSYPLDAQGYVDFCDHCKAVADELKKLGIKSHRENGEWFVADVEAVIFHYIRYKKHFSAIL